MQDDRPAIPYRRISNGTNQDSELIRAGKTWLRMLCVTNTGSSAVYLKLYDKATAPTVGTDTPALTFCIPGSSTGDGNNVPIPINGINFVNGLGVGLTTGVADNNTTAVNANEVIVNAAYNAGL